MPIYEYECPSCGERFEIRRSMTDNNKETKCPKCGNGNPNRIFSIFTTASAGAPCTPSSGT